MIHKQLQNMIVEAISTIEVVNGRDCREVGIKYKEETRHIQKELEEWDKEKPKGLTESENIIQDAIEDPTFELDAIMAKFKLADDSDDGEE